MQDRYNDKHFFKLIFTGLQMLSMSILYKYTLITIDIFFRTPAEQIPPRHQNHVLIGYTYILLI